MKFSSSSIDCVAEYYRRDLEAFYICAQHAYAHPCQQTLSESQSIALTEHSEGIENQDCYTRRPGP